jgi:hypothetical protein
MNDAILRCVPDRDGALVAAFVNADDAVVLRVEISSFSTW